MLTIRRSACMSTRLCSRRQHCMARSVCAAVTFAGGAAARREVPATFTTTPSTSCGGGAAAAPAAVAAGGGGFAVSADASTSPPPQQPPQVHFRLRRISGDGACMFRAIAQGAQLATHGKAMSPESEEVAALNLRQAVVHELRKRREEMEPFLPGIAADFDDYCRTMSHPMAWGGEPEMVMAVHVVQRPITVYHIEGGALAPIVTYGDHLLGAVQPIHLLWSGAHYDLLVPEGPPPPTAAGASNGAAAA